MHRRILLVTLFAAATFATILALGQTPARAYPSPSAVTSSVAPPKDPPELVEAKEEIRQLQTQVQVMKDYHGSLLDTVYWALGSVFVLMSIIVGFGWFANFKVYERDKQMLRDELDAQLKVQKVELAEAIKLLSTELMETITSRIDQSTVELRGQVTSEIASAIEPVKSSVLGVSNRIFQLELEGRKAKMYSNPDDDMALTNALGVLELCRTRAQDELPDIMNFMLKKIDKGGRLTAHEITRLNALLDALPAHYKALSDRLRNKLVASDIF